MMTLLVCGLRLQKLFFFSFSVFFRSMFVSQPGLIAIRHKNTREQVMPRLKVFLFFNTNIGTYVDRSRLFEPLPLK